MPDTVYLLSTHVNTNSPFQTFSGCTLLGANPKMWGKIFMITLREHSFQNMKTIDL